MYCNIQQNIWDLHKLGDITHIFIEDAFTVALRAGNNNLQWMKDVACLIGHAKSIAEAMGCRQVKEVPLETWRKHFIGGDTVQREKKAARIQSKLQDKRISATQALKDLTQLRCAQLGLKTSVEDEADAIGILSYALDWHGITPPWEMDNVLRPEMVL